MLETTHNVQMNTNELNVIIRALEIMRDCDTTEHADYLYAKEIIEVLRLDK
jgi:hypothetical protein